MGPPKNVISFITFAAFLLQLSSGGSVDEKSQLELAFKRGNIQQVRALIGNGTLEHFSGPKDIHKIYDKLRIVQLLLDNGIVGINTQANDLAKTEGAFEVDLIPGSSLKTHLVVNIPALKKWGNRTIRDGMKPIHAICLLPDVSPRIVKIILENGNDDVNSRTDSGATPLMLAATSGTVELVNFLIERGAKIKDVASIKYTDEELDGHFIFAKLFSKKELKSLYSHIHYSTLVASIIGHNIDVLKYLISKGADVNNGGQNWLVLFPAVQRNNRDILDILLQNGVDVNGKDMYGSTPLHKAAESGRLEMAKILLKKGARLNATDSLGWKPIHVASFFSKICGKEMIQFLVESGNSIESLTDGGYSPLHLVELVYNGELLLYLLKNVGNLNQTNTYAEIPGKDSIKNHTDIVDFVIQLGAPLNQQDDILGWTALHWAAAAGDLDVVKLLVQNGAKTDLKSKMGHDPLETATLFGRTKVAEILKSAKG